MPQLLGKIAPQQYEVLRDTIAVILAAELAAQYALYNDLEKAADPLQEVLAAKVFSERVIPQRVEEEAIVNVQLAFGDYDQVATPDKADGRYTFFIDCYSGGIGTADEFSDKNARLKVQRLLGACRAILSSPHYITLGYKPPAIARRFVSRLEMQDPLNNADAQNRTMGRLVFEVHAPEYVELIAAGALNELQTQVKLSDTDQGHFWDVDATP